ncbi:MAG: SCP2 sterol-binding domain-containing protein [Candidatus Eremiobacteraeota bacterium]|nr:SCP2 sterol-binding domain-containing protein [Candidatus Eremiobacteraeota bacterium]
MTHERFVAFLRAVSSSDDGRDFASANVVAAFEAHDIGSRIVIDTTGRPGDGSWFSIHVGEAAPPAEVTFSALAETFDRVLRGELGIMLAITSRKILTEGKVARAMRLVPAFARSLPHYR